jgi:DNA (cytosine-5)-methyltransferase 1
MAVCYNKLWKLLIDRGMSKTQLIKQAKISTNAMAHLGKNEDVRVEVLVKICDTLGVGMDDILELVPSDEENIQ